MGIRWERGVATPVAIGLATAAVALVVVLARLVVAADGDVSRFVAAGSDFVDAASVRPPIHVFDGSGYDGQFYFRLATAPSARTLEPTNGVRMDQPVRFARPTYPTAAWLGALGRSAWVPWSLVLVNVVAMGVLAAAAAAWCADRSLDPRWGILPALTGGLVLALARDLTEIVMCALVALTVLAVGRSRHVLAAAALSLAVLSHEQALCLVAGLAVARGVELVRRRRPTGVDLVWTVPIVVVVCWQVWSMHVAGRSPAGNTLGKNLDVPFVGVVRLLARWARNDLSRQQVVSPLQLTLVVATVAVAAVAWRRVPRFDRWLLASFAVAVMLATCTSYNVWKASAELRLLVLVPLLAWAVMGAARRVPPRWLVASTAAVWLLSVGLRVVAI